MINHRFKFITCALLILKFNTNVLYIQKNKDICTVVKW